MRKNTRTFKLLQEVMVKDELQGMIMAPGVMLVKGKESLKVENILLKNKLKEKLEFKINLANREDGQQFTREEVAAINSQPLSSGDQKERNQASKERSFGFNDRHSTGI